MYKCKYMQSKLLRESKVKVIVLQKNVTCDCSITINYIIELFILMNKHV